MTLLYNGHPIEYIGQNYYLTEHVMESGTLTVYLAWDEQTQQEVLLTISATNRLDQEIERHFLHEANQLALQQGQALIYTPNDVQIERLNLDQSAFLLYLVTPYTPDEELWPKKHPLNEYTSNLTPDSADPQALQHSTPFPQPILFFDSQRQTGRTHTTKPNIASTDKHSWSGLPLHTPPLQRPVSRTSRHRNTSHRGYTRKYLNVRKTVLLLISLLMLSLIVGGSILAIHWLSSPGSPTITVTLTPNAYLVRRPYQFTAVLGTPDPHKNQVQARMLPVISLTQTLTTNSSGTSKATSATGTLVFFNNAGIDVTVNSVTIKGKSGVAVTFQGTITVPAANPSEARVQAYAVNPGDSGNIPALDINQACCAHGIIVKNDRFSGGQNAQTGVVQQSDIDNAAQTLEQQLQSTEQQRLQKEARSGERVVDNSLQCQHTISSDHHTGEAVPAFTVTVVLTCSAEAYSFQAAQALATSQLSASIATDPRLSNGFVLVKPIIVALLKTPSADAAGRVALSIQAKGLWAYRLTPDLLHLLARQIAGKSKADAQTLLLHHTGIVGAQISTPGQLPTDVTRIRIIVGPPSNATTSP